MVELFYYTGRAWIQIDKNKLIYPNQQTYGIDSGADTMQASFYASSDFCLPVETPIQIKYNSESRYFVVKDSSYIDMQYETLYSNNTRERICTLQLVEPIEILKGFKVQACSFAQTRYTLKRVIMRLCKFAGFEYGKISIDNGNKILRNRIDFPSTTLYLALSELARKYDSTPYLDFETGRWTIKFQRLDGLNDTVYDEFILTPFSQGQYRGDGIAKSVYMEATNVLTGGMFVSNLTPIATDGSSTININNFGIQSTNNIDKLVSLNIQSDNYNWRFSNNLQIKYINYDDDNNPNAVTIREMERKIYIVTKSTYDNLSTQDKNDYNNIYIYWENKLIYLNELKKLADATSSWDSRIFKIYKSVEYTSGLIPEPEFSHLLHSYEEPIWYKTISFTGQFTTANEIPFYAFNESDNENTVFYNQTSQKLDPISMGDTLQSYIDNMQNGNYYRKGVFYNWSDIPKEGSVIKIRNKPMIVNSLTIVENLNYYDVTFNLVEKHAHRRDYMGADTTLQLNDMANKDIINSNNISVAQINYSMFDKIEVVNDLDVNIEQTAFVAPLKGSAMNIWHWYMTFYYTGTKSYNYKTFGAVDNFANSLLFYVKGLNNFVWQQEADNSGNLIPYNYTNSSGEIKKVNIKLRNENDIIMYQQEAESTSDIPIKDKHEIFTQTLQFIYKGVGNTIVRNEYVDYLLNEDLWEECTVLAYDTNIGKFDEKPTNYLDLTGGYISINTEQQYILISLNKILDVACKSIVVRGDTDILFIKNYDEITNINTGEIKIYYNIKKPLLPRTGVKGYKY